MKRLTIAATAAITLALVAPAALAAGKTHHVAMHVDQNDPAVMNLVLNNVSNLEAYYKSLGDDVKIEVVAYGPGLTMLIDGKSPVAARVSTMALQYDNLTFDACHNTMKAMEKKTGHPVKLLEEATVVPAGVAKLIELQEEGYSYIRP